MYQNDDAKQEYVVGIQFNHSICAGTFTFIDKEDRTSKAFPSKVRQVIGTERTMFIGVDVCQKRKQCACTTTQKQDIENIEKLKINKELSFDYFRQNWAKYTYAPFSTVPHILIFVTLLSQITEERFEANKSIAT